MSGVVEHLDVHYLPMPDAIAPAGVAANDVEAVKTVTGVRPTKLSRHHP
jgi:hypothetical protein